MMKKDNIKGFVILGILFVMVSVIAFAVPIQKTTAFWIVYAFTVIAVMTQVIIWRATFSRKNTSKSKFLGLPVLYIGIVYLIVQLVTFTVYLFNPTLPIWSAIVICVSLGGISSICMISVNIGGNKIEQVETKIQKKVFYIKELQTDVELLADKESDVAVKTALIQLAERIRFSDPISNERLSDLEKTISTKVAGLKTASNKLEAIIELNSLLDERNKKCKILK